MGVGRVRGKTEADGQWSVLRGAEVASLPMPERITTEDVAHVAKLARLRVEAHELEVFTEQLAKVLGHAEDLAVLDLEGVPPTAHPLPMENVFRPDVVGPTLDRAEVLAQAPAAEQDQFKVPPILGEEP